MEKFIHLLYGHGFVPFVWTEDLGFKKATQFVDVENKMWKEVHVENMFWIRSKLASPQVKKKLRL